MTAATAFDDYIRRLAFEYLQIGPYSARWESATDQERDAAWKVVKRMSREVVTPYSLDD